MVEDRDKENCKVSRVTSQHYTDNLGTKVRILNDKYRDDSKEV